MATRNTLAFRAILAVFLMVFFYVFAVALAAGLLYVAYLDIKTGKRISIRLLLFCGVGALSILWSILPRFDRFEPPGPRLDPARHPLLFRELGRIALSVGHPMPEEVYLVPDLNAWVAHRGGIMGFGSRPVMGLGLPLLQVLTVSELGAVLAHEFGHYLGGDTKLAPWIYKTRQAIVRTLENLSNRILSYPFLWYGKLYLRITNAISRKQEFEADQLAAATAGAPAAMEALKKTYKIAPGFEHFWQNEAGPILVCGFRPPLVEGFAAYLEEPEVKVLLAEQEARDMAEADADPYDTHPPLPGRLAALAKAPTTNRTPDCRSALSLLEGVDRLEEEMIGLLVKPESGKPFAAIAWSEVGESVFLPQWRKEADRFGIRLEEFRLGTLAGHALKPAKLLDLFVLDMDVSAPVEQKMEYVQALIGLLVAVILKERGWAFAIRPGKTVEATCNGYAVKPFTLLGDLAAGRIPEAAWEELCRANGLDQVGLNDWKRA